MSNSPNYGYNPNPQFSVNHISDYLATSYATQRTKLICAAKFPKKVEVASYSQIRNRLKVALTQPDFDRDGLDFLVDKLESKAQSEIGYNRDEALRCAKAVRAFQSTFQPKKFAKYDISAGGKTLIKPVMGVKLKVTLDAILMEIKEDVVSAGGITMLYAFSADRPDLKDRLSAMAGLVLWALEDGQMPPLPRLCMAVDIADTKIVKASASHQRFRERVEASCREVAAQWDDIEPPHDYDGPEWR